MTAIDYDPNLIAWPKKAAFEVKLTFGEWRYRAAMQITVRGNVRGFDVIEAAVEYAYEKLRGDADFATLSMEDSDGNILISEDDEGGEDEWLKEKLIGAEIIAATPILHGGDKAVTAAEVSNDR